jgi:P27 family predicted phage terminase small subunit
MAGRKARPFELVDKKGKTKLEIETRTDFEPKPVTQLRPPKSLSREAKKEWKGIVKRYIDMSIPLHLIDARALAIYCGLIVSYNKSVIKIEEQDEVLTNSRGGRYKNPWVDIQLKLIIQLKSYSELLLLDPFSRAKIGVMVTKMFKAENASDEMEKFLEEL